MLGSAAEPRCHPAPSIMDYSQTPFLLHKKQVEDVCPSPRPIS